MEKVQSPVILCVIHHHQNPLESIQKRNVISSAPQTILAPFHFCNHIRDLLVLHTDRLRDFYVLSGYVERHVNYTSFRGPYLLGLIRSITSRFLPGVALQLETLFSFGQSLSIFLSPKITSYDRFQ
jgi:hypothetical protein